MVHADFTENARMWRDVTATRRDFEPREEKKETLHIHVKRQIQYVLCPSKVESLRSPLRRRRSVQSLHIIRNYALATNYLYVKFTQAYNSTHLAFAVHNMLFFDFESILLIWFYCRNKWQPFNIFYKYILFIKFVRKYFLFSYSKCI